MQCNTMQFNAIQCNAMQCNATVTRYIKTDGHTWEMAMYVVYYHSRFTPKSIAVAKNLSSEWC
jgi:hypothetical protein